jgi:hypothetical protein
MFRAAVDKSSNDARQQTLDANLAVLLMWICVAFGGTGVILLAFEKGNSMTHGPKTSWPY